jgi:hypothetical protein
MLENDYFARKRVELGLDRGDSLAAVQRALDALYPGLVRALSLNDGVLRLTTPNSSVASELRLRQVELLAKFNNAEIKRLQIAIRS